MKIKLALVAVLATFMVTECPGPVRPDPPKQEFVFIDPEKTPELDLKSVEVEVWNRTRLAEEAAKESNKDEVFFVFTREQFGRLADNLTDISDVFAKSIENNKYYQEAITKYREEKRKELEAEAAKLKESK